MQEFSFNESQSSNYFIFKDIRLKVRLEFIVRSRNFPDWSFFQIVKYFLKFSFQSFKIKAFTALKRKILKEEKI